MVTESQVWAALDEVIHPLFGMSLVALEMVRAVRVGEREIEVDLVLNCAGCPGPEAALALARAKLRGINGGGGLKLILLPAVWKPPWNPSDDF